MKIPAEIISKYNILKEGAYSQLNLPFVPIDVAKHAQSTLGSSQGLTRQAYSSPTEQPQPAQSAEVYLLLVKNVTQLSEYVLEHLLENLLSIEKYVSLFNDGYYV